MTSIMTSSSNLTFLKNNVKGLQSLKKRIKLIEYFKGKLKHNEFLSYKKHIPILRMKIILGSIILVGGCSFLMEHLTLAVL